MPKPPAMEHNDRSLAAMAAAFKRAAELLLDAADCYAQAGLTDPIKLEGQDAIDKGLWAAKKLAATARHRVELATLQKDLETTKGKRLIDATESEDGSVLLTYGAIPKKKKQSKKKSAKRKRT